MNSALLIMDEFRYHQASGARYRALGMQENLGRGTLARRAWRRERVSVGCGRVRLVGNGGCVRRMVASESFVPMAGREGGEQRSAFKRLGFECGMELAARNHGLLGCIDVST